MQALAVLNCQRSIEKVLIDNGITKDQAPSLGAKILSDLLSDPARLDRANGHGPWPWLDVIDGRPQEQA